MIKYFKNSWLKRSCRSIFKIFVILSIYSAHTFAHNPIVNFHHLTPKDGLTQNHINSIIQDSKGFLWIGTFNGLNRYDGYNIRQYYNEINDPNSLSHQSINIIYEDRDETIWVGTENGLNKFNRQTNDFTRYYQQSKKLSGEKTNDIRTIYQDQDGSLWIGFYGQGLKKFNPKTGLFMDLDLFIGKTHTDTARYINTFYADRESNLWIGTERNGLLRYNVTDKSIKQYSSNVDADVFLGDSCIAIIKEDDSNNLWIGTWGSGLSVLNKKTDSLTIYNTDTSKSISNNLVTSILVDKNYVWIGTFGGGLNRYNKKNDTFTTYKHDPTNINSLSNNTIWTIAKDNFNVLWVGTYGGSVNKCLTENNPSESYQFEASRNNWLNNDHILSFFESSNGLIYIGTSGGGINIFDREKRLFSYLLNNTNLKSSTIRSVFEDNNQELWAGTDAGVYRFSKSRKSNKFYPLSTKANTLGPNSIYSIAQDKEGNMWFGTWRNGLKKLAASQLTKEPQQVEFLSFDNEEFSQNTVWSIFEDSKGDLWIGSTKSLFRYNYVSKTFDKFTPTQENSQNLKISNLGISCFLEDEQNQKLWFGTLGNGIGEFDLKSKKFYFLSSKENKGRDEVFSIYADKNWNIWMGSNLGLAKYDIKLNEFQEITLNQSKKNEIIDRLYQLKSKELLLGGNSGFYIFDPVSYTEKPIMSQIALTDFRIYNTSVSELDISNLDLNFRAINSKETIKLNPKINVFSIEFSSLDFREPEKIKYQYIMEGFDKDWTTTNAKNRLATYTNLNSGQYTFKVKATNSDGLWSNDIKTLSIIITPHWYRSSAVLIIAPIFILYLLLQFFRFNRKRIRGSIAIRDFKKTNSKLLKEQKKNDEQNKRLAESLTRNGKELAATKLLVHEKNEIMATLREKLLGLLNHASQAQKSQITPILNQLDSELKDMQGWDSLKENLDILQNDFLKRLAEKYPELTQNDLRLCYLIITGKTNKEIAKINNISIHSVEMSRYRIRKKMNLKRSELLNEFLIRF